MSDLLIGTRRTQGRPLRALAIGAVLIFVIGLGSYLIYGRMVAYPHPDGEIPRTELSSSDMSLRYGESSLSFAGPIRVLRVVGTPHTVGASRGRLLAGAVADVGETIEETIQRTVPRTGALAGLVRGIRLRWRYRLLDDGVPGHQLVEVAGVLRGAARSGTSVPSYESYVRHQAFLDVGKPAPWSAGASEQAVARSLSFAAIARSPSGDRLMLGRSFGLPGLSDSGLAASRHVTVSFVRAESVIPFASVAWPGAVGVVTGINAEGVVVLVHPARTDDVRTTRRAQPIPLLARDVLENAHTLDEAIKIVEASATLGTASFLVADGNARTFAVVERSPTRVAVRRFSNAPVANELLSGKPFIDDPQNDRARRSRPSETRSRRAEQVLSSSPPESAADIAAILRDRRGDDGGQLPFGHRATIEDVAAQHTAIVDASAMVLWVAEGPGSSGRFRAFDLRHELRGEGARPAPPPDIAADRDQIVSEANAAASALQDVHDARYTIRKGGDRAARELVSRALARAPTVPQALLLAGELARERGDDETAIAMYTRYMEVAGDDPLAGRQIEAVLKDR